jgi:SAM-dependent methyltransferase
MTTLSEPSPRPPTASSGLEGAAVSYEALASSYDRFTAGYRHDVWLSRVEQIAIDHGLRGRNLLDVGCGTGKSFLPMLDRGYEVTACDLSASILAIARRKAPHVSLHQADLRALPVFGEFHLVTVLDDPLNYLLTEDELYAALSGIARNLASAGLVIFDLNTLAQYRGQFARDAAIDDGDVFFAWRGDEGNLQANSGVTVEVTLEVFSDLGGGIWERRSSVHRQRHWSCDTVRLLAREAGLQVLAVYGQRSGGRVDEALDELVHPKGIYVARRQEGVTMDIGSLP